MALVQCAGRKKGPSAGPPPWTAAVATVTADVEVVPLRAAVAAVSGRGARAAVGTRRARAATAAAAAAVMMMRRSQSRIGRSGRGGRTGAQAAVVLWRPQRSRRSCCGGRAVVARVLRRQQRLQHEHCGVAAVTCAAGAAGGVAADSAKAVGDSHQDYGVHDRFTRCLHARCTGPCEMRAVAELARGFTLGRIAGNAHTHARGGAGKRPPPIHTNRVGGGGHVDGAGVGRVEARAQGHICTEAIVGQGKAGQRRVSSSPWARREGEKKMVARPQRHKPARRWGPHWRRRRKR